MRRQRDGLDVGAAAGAELAGFDVPADPPPAPGAAPGPVEAAAGLVPSPAGGAGAIEGSTASLSTTSFTPSVDLATARARCFSASLAAFPVSVTTWRFVSTWIAAAFGTLRSASSWDFTFEVSPASDCAQATANNARTRLPIHEDTFRAIGFSSASICRRAGGPGTCRRRMLQCSFRAVRRGRNAPERSRFVILGR